MLSESCLVFSSATRLLFPVGSTVFLRVLGRGSLPAFLQHAPGDRPAPPRGHLQHPLLPSAPQPKALPVLGAAWTLCCLFLSTQAPFSNGLRANLFQSRSALCSPERTGFPGRPPADCQFKYLCQGEKGSFSGEVGAGLPLLTGMPDGI